MIIQGCNCLKGNFFLLFIYIIFLYFPHYYYYQEHWFSNKDATSLKPMHLTSADGVEDMVRDIKLYFYYLIGESLFDLQVNCLRF